ncbi:kelch-like protein 24 [Mesocricetus auratus]|uniref:Kelch-like protein 24 n=1 Tax=Mesocricetus auratus TaxID=10036 RepID=A0ABM2WFE2_MESAU|nr:kelch-like protein 24 [Mesocricetus auratus]
MGIRKQGHNSEIPNNECEKNEQRISHSEELSVCLTREELGVSDSRKAQPKVFQMDPRYLTGHEYFNFSSGSSHAENVLQLFNNFRDSQLFTDVIISVEGQEFPCHRAVLSACSSYFRAMFCNDHRESKERLIEINGIRAEAMECFLEYVYTGHVQITADNVQSLFEASSLFQMDILCDVCTNFLEEQLDPCNCLGIQRFADRHSLRMLFAKCHTFALQAFEDVYQHEEFLELGKDELIDYICNDELVVTKEELVFEAVMRWVRGAAEHRRLLLHELLAHVRLPLLNPNYFIHTVEVDHLIQNSPKCHQLLHEARRYHILGNELISPRTRPRRSTGYSEVIVVVGGCERPGEFNLPYTECYDPVTGEWKSLAKLPEFTKSEYAVCALKNNILVSGGRINSRDVWIYNSKLNIWVRVAPLNKGRWRHKMAVLLGKVYVVGGYDGQTRLRSVEYYDSFSNRWTEVAPLKEAVSSPAVTSCVGKLFVIGGRRDANTCCNKVQVYDPEINSWLLCAAIPVIKRSITAVSLNNLIYVAGGLTKAMYCYDPVEDYWMHVQNTFYRQENCGMSVCNGKIYILGGRRENGDATDTVLCYDPETSIISRVAAMPRPVSYHGCVTIHRYNEKCFKF